jgi:hypothetical protein
MAAKPASFRLPTPRLTSLRLPAEQTLPALAGNAHVIWRLLAQERHLSETDSGNPSEEYRSACEFLRLYATLRFYQLALLLGTTGSLVTALSSSAVQTSFARAQFLKAGGLIVSLALLVMEFRASSYWHAMRERADELARVLQFRAFPRSSRWSPLTTSGASFYLHVLVASLWFASLFVRLQPGL